MRIDSQEPVLGQSSIKMRRLFRYVKGRAWDEDWLVNLITDIVQISCKESERLIKDLELEGYIEKGSYGLVSTIKGNSLAMASAAKPIHRATADKKIVEFLKRVKVVNEDPYYLFKVKRVIVFGSYLGSNERLNDIDIAIELLPKEEDSNKHIELTEQRSREAIEQGRRFSNIAEELFWAREEVKRFLKHRSSSISLHETDDPILKQVDYRILYGE